MLQKRVAGKKIIKKAQPLCKLAGLDFETIGLERFEVLGQGTLNAEPGQSNLPNP